ncbi:site-specific DNA-methyltransferase [Bradyrhizobium sp. 6(2017)]|uniref:site-specific DNA-methyltransferase n=1 Tax=Bradyrhizobium sp. 6(2017) TaxID=1197460 RepID=UPI0013E17C9A|nr:site-specific DNA-methyltransferase [Bradyrhizobium sp. 6(2017)]QIG97180.1 site-specific DNA-methyltransferase [Bradyrhizobium sp. 6(2017)]
MSNRKQRLELTWIGKNERPRLEPRILLEDEDKSYHAKVHVADHDIFDNFVIHGDNLLALKALLPDYAGKVRCIYGDPPYNTRSAIPEYEDGIEHSLWLSLIRERIELCHKLLSDDGSIWINLDDHEGHYFKVMCDEVFGRGNFVTTIIWQKKYAPKADTRFISDSHDFIFVYAKNIESLRLNWLPKTEKQTDRYRNPDNDPRGPWKPGDTLRNEVRDYAVFPVRLPSGREVWPSDGTSWRYTREKFAELIAENRIWFGANGDSRPAIKRFITDVTDKMPPVSIWGYDEVGHNDEAKKESKKLFGEKLFSTPKPERLIQRVLTIGSDPADLVLDSFAGSGTTGAVAQKMGRRWIMVELGEHCETHILPRMKKVIDGDDPGGITEAMNWKGGGGFRYYRLAPSLLEKDAWGNWVISKDYDPAKVAQAVCKLMGFVYQPDEIHYWMQGRSSETDYIYVTTQSLTHDQLAAISEEVGGERTLLVCCKAFHANADAFSNLTIRKIPQAVLRKCEWGKDDYSLTVASLPEAPRERAETDDPTPPAKAGKKYSNGKAAAQDDLFSQGDGK